MWTWVPLFLAASFAAAGVADPALASAASFAVVAIGGDRLRRRRASLADRLGRTTLTIAAMAGSGASALVAGLVFGAPPRSSTLVGRRLGAHGRRRLGPVLGGGLGALAARARPDPRCRSSSRSASCSPAVTILVVGAARSGRRLDLAGRVLDARARPGGRDRRDVAAPGPARGGEDGERPPMTDSSPGCAALEPARPTSSRRGGASTTGQFLSVRREVRRRVRARVGRATSSASSRRPRDALRDVVEALPDRAFALPGGEGDWNVAEAVGHVAAVAGRARARRRARRRGPLARRRADGRAGHPGPAGRRPRRARREDRPEPADHRAARRRRSTATSSEPLPARPSARRPAALRRVAALRRRPRPHAPRAAPRDRHGGRRPVAEE